MITPYLRLMRPANMITTLGDLLLGFAIAGLIIDIVKYNKIILINIDPLYLSLLTLCSASLYTGGVVLNDLLDMENDFIIDPEKPIPSGEVSKNSALVLGTLFTVAGIAAGFSVSLLSGIIAILIAVFAFLHNYYKNHFNIGSFCLGMCRSLNMLLGMSLIHNAINQYWYIALLPLIYILTSALLSSGDTYGSVKSVIETTMLIYALIVIAILSFSFTIKFRMIHCLPFLILFIFALLPGLIKAHQTPEPSQLKKVVRKSVHSFYILEAAIASGFSGYEFGILILGLLPISVVISRIIDESESLNLLLKMKKVKNNKKH